MKISIIIPTHNRAQLLKNVIDSVVALKNEADFEFIIVDNNSTDNTKAVAESYADIAKYVFESRTAFTRARRTGAENATGDIFLYLDDDVIVNPGSLKHIVSVFTEYPDCGVIAGMIQPGFTEIPPDWTLECQKSFNGWSLYSPEEMPVLESGFQEVEWAAGPMMAIRRSAYEMVDGFPPDTVGVETNKGPKSFNKLYIGPGDYGLCYKVREAGFKVYYHPDISVYHVIPPIRFTISFWRSRLIGEGYHEAITQRAFFKLNKAEANKKRFRFQMSHYHQEQMLLAKLKFLEGNGREKVSFDGMYPEELWTVYFKAYLDMDWVLRKYPNLWQFLWEIGYEGVSDQDFDRISQSLPAEYKNLVSSEFVYESSPLNSVAEYRKIIGNRGYYRGSIRVPMLTNLKKCAGYARKLTK